MASKGGQPKNMVCKGGVTKKYLSSDSICYNANISARRLKIAFQIFPGENAPGAPYFIIHPTTTLPHQLRNVNSFLASAGLILKQLNN